MSALGQKQTCAVHKPMSAKCQKQTRPTSHKNLSEARPVVSGKSFDFVFGQLRGDQPHAAIDVIATLARCIELKLLNEIFLALFREDRGLDRAAGSGPMAGSTGRNVPVRIAEFNEVNDGRWRFRERDRIGIALGRPA